MRSLTVPSYSLQSWSEIRSRSVRDRRISASKTTEEPDRAAICRGVPSGLSKPTNAVGYDPSQWMEKPRSGEPEIRKVRTRCGAFPSSILKKASLSRRGDRAWATPFSTAFSVSCVSSARKASALRPGDLVAGLGRVPREGGTVREADVDQARHVAVELRPPAGGGEFLHLGGEDASRHVLDRGVGPRVQRVGGRIPDRTEQRRPERVRVRTGEGAGGIVGATNRNVTNCTQYFPEVFV